MEFLLRRCFSDLVDAVRSLDSCCFERCPCRAYRTTSWGDNGPRPHSDGFSTLYRLASGIISTRNRPELQVSPCTAWCKPALQGARECQKAFGTRLGRWKLAQAPSSGQIFRQPTNLHSDLTAGSFIGRPMPGKHEAWKVVHTRDSPSFSRSMVT